MKYFQKVNKETMPEALSGEPQANDDSPLTLLFFTLYIVDRDLITLRQRYQILQLESLSTHIDRLILSKIRGIFLFLIDFINLLLKNNIIFETNKHTVCAGW